MDKLIELYLNKDLNIYDTKEIINNELNGELTPDVFNELFKSFLLINSSLYYDGNVFIERRGNEYKLDKIIINNLLKMYLYADTKKLEKEKYLISEFLCTYFNTIMNAEFKSKVSNYEEILKIFRECIEENGLRKEFYSIFFENCFNYYIEIIKIAIENNISISHNQIRRMLNNLSRSFTQKEYNEIIEMLAKNEKNLYDIVIYDNNKKNHIDTYLKYILESLDKYGGYNYAKEIIKELAKSKSLEDDDLKKIINKYIEITNVICNKLVKKEGPFINRLADIDNLKLELQYILESVNYLCEDERDAIHKCLINLLRLKRFIISDKSYVTQKFVEITGEASIPKESIDMIQSELDNNCLKLYSISKEDFVEAIKNSIEMYSKYPIVDLATIYTIDSEKQVYRKNITLDSNNSFESIFNEIGNRYSIENSKKLTNIIRENEYYTILLKHLSKIFNIHQNLIVSMLGKENIANLLAKLKNKFEYEKELNDYSIAVMNVLSIEYYIHKILRENGESPTKDGVTNINMLVKLFKDDNEILNGLMYINYTLYEFDGLNLRNNLLHGNLINADLTIPLITTFSGLIFVNLMDHGT